jgi:transposase
MEGGQVLHKGKVVVEVGLRRIYQPSYSPELNPAERVFAEVRRWVGRATV